MLGEALGDALGEALGDALGAWLGDALGNVLGEATGDALEKPGFYVDGNIHGSEVTASVTALYFAWSLLSGHGEDEALTRLVDETTFYIIPAVSPDGVELVLSNAGIVRSGTRMYPHEEERDGLHAEDIDGEGLLLSMRIEDEVCWSAGEAVSASPVSADLQPYQGTLPSIPPGTVHAKYLLDTQEHDEKGEMAHEGCQQEADGGENLDGYGE